MATVKAKTRPASSGTGGDVEVNKYKQNFENFNRNWMKEQGVWIDWEIKERNKYWHDTYFTKRSVKDHQAKGNCRFVTNCLEELERLDWIKPGDLVFDPMCGIGSFLVVAALKGYNGVGIELEKRFCRDMLGYDEHIEIDASDDMFASFVNRQHVEGNIERFHKLTAAVPSVGRIAIINGDARNAHELLPSSNLRLNSKGKVYALCSPPYGNRLSDVTQTAGADDGRDWPELEEESDGRRQYSNDSDNIGTNRIITVSSPPYSGTTEFDASRSDVLGGRQDRRPVKNQHYSKDNIAKNRLAIVSSPPYSRTTEHDAKQIDNLQKGKVGGHRGFVYSNRENIALLKIGPYDTEMLKVYQSLYKTIGIGSPVVLLTRNFIQKGKVVLLDELTIKLMEEAGFTYKFTKRAELPDISMFKYMNWNKIHREKELPLITWEEATFYLKETRNG